MIIERKYKVLDQIGKGSFGYVVKGENIVTGSPVAIKIEGRDSITLRNEAKIYKLLQNIIGVPSIYNYGVNDNMSYLIMDLLGAPLVPLANDDHLHDICKQSLDILEHIHKENVLHRDIKPENFLFDIDNKSLYLIDYGISTYISPDTIKSKSLVGTPSYMSLSIHDGHGHAYRDDVESLGYTLLWLKDGSVPWENDADDIIVSKKRYLLCDPDNEDDLFIYDWIRECRSTLLSVRPSYEDLYDIFHSSL